MQALLFEDVRLKKENVATKERSEAGSSTIVVANMIDNIWQLYLFHFILSKPRLYDYPSLYCSWIVYISNNFISKNDC